MDDDIVDKIYKEIDEREEIVEKYDFDIQMKNREQFRSFWLHMIILSSAIVIGVLPLLKSNSDIIQSQIICLFGLLFILLVCIFIVIYMPYVLQREKSLLVEQSQLHQEIFFK